jgi:RNA polymerase sigma factor (sigma-70 family)
MAEPDDRREKHAPAIPAEEGGPDARTTCWLVIEKAAAGSQEDRDLFVRLYGPVVRAYLKARWRGSPYFLQEVENAYQDVFIECFKRHGVLEHCRPADAGGFRPYFRGVIRNVARRIEARVVRSERQAPEAEMLEAIPGAEEELSGVFDRAWATAIVREARRRLTERAQRKGGEALRRVELLRLRFQEGLPVREIARLWGADPETVHSSYERARQEFDLALREVAEFERPGESRQLLAEVLEALGCNPAYPSCEKGENHG